MGWNKQSGVVSYFCAIEPRAITRDRTFRIYVSRDMLAGAFIAGQIYDEAAFKRMFAQHQWMAVFFKSVIRRSLAKRREREVQYDAAEPFTASLLQLNSHNFQLARREIQRVHLRRKRTPRAPHDVGVIDIQMADGRSRRLIVIGGQDTEQLIELLRMFAPGLEVSGTESYELPPPPKPESAAVRRGFLLIIGGFFVLFGVAAIAMDRAGLAQKQKLIGLGALNLLVGGWCLFTAWRNRGPTEPHESLTP